MFQPWTRVLSTCSNYQWWSTATHRISTQQMDMNVLKSKATLPEMTYPTRRCLSTRLLYTGPYIIVFCSDTHTLLAKSVWQICHRGMPCKRESCDNWKALMPQELVLVCLGPPPALYCPLYAGLCMLLCINFILLPITCANVSDISALSNYKKHGWQQGCSTLSAASSRSIHLWWMKP